MNHTELSGAQAPTACLGAAIAAARGRAEPLRRCVLALVALLVFALTLVWFGRYAEAAWLAFVSSGVAYVTRVLRLRIKEDVPAQYLAEVKAAGWSLPARALIANACRNGSQVRWIDLEAAVRAEARYANGQAVVRARIDRQLRKQGAVMRASQLAAAVSGADIDSFGRLAG